MSPNETILITGGTGSFGRILAKEMLKKNQISEIRILSRDEAKQDVMRREFNHPKLNFFIGDIRDKSAVNFATKGVQYIFHTAALKQVPSTESFPLEAVKTNILGTENVLEAAEIHGVKKVVILSTDKAVYPINAMGMTKALMEKIMVARSLKLNSNQPIFCAARFGNIIGTRGSVVPLFVEQLKSGKPLTITDPAMTRFFMPLSSAIELIEMVFEKGNQGEIFVQKSSAVSLGILAEALKEIYGIPAKTVLIGSRPGDKENETLITLEEMSRVENHSGFVKIRPRNRTVHNEISSSEKLNSESQFKEYTSKNAHQLTKDEVKKLLLELDFIKQDLAIT